VTETGHSVTDSDSLRSEWLSQSLSVSHAQSHVLSFVKARRAAIANHEMMNKRMIIL